MPDETFPREEDLESRQAAALYPVGRALRDTYDAENHDTLGNELTGLMLELARIDPDTPPLPRGAMPPAAAAAPAVAAVATSAAAPMAASGWRGAIERLLGR